MSTKSDRLLAVQVLCSLLSEEGSLSSQLARLNAQNPQANLALIREYTYGACRWYPRLASMLSALMDKPLRQKDRDVHCLLLLGLYQLFYMRVPDHAAINETVSVTRQLKKDWARKLVNAVLRSAQRQQTELEKAMDADPQTRYAHPAWLIARIKRDWPEHVEAILDANNQQAAMTLRVNRLQTSRADYLAALVSHGIKACPGNLAETAVLLDSPVNVASLPGFDTGLVSVQDEASQLAASLLAVPPGSLVLDACAAPGGKTCALLESSPYMQALVALDSSSSRLVRIHENLQRLGLKASVQCADAAQLQSWWDGVPFDAILLDAPCSATGVIRRHPDIKVLRKEAEILRLQDQQQLLLKALWPSLKPGGKLLYSTCSVLKTENEQQIAAFIDATPDARAIQVSHPVALECSVGMQFHPGTEQADGFYYALLEKC